MAKEPGRNNSSDELKVKIARSRDRVARDFRGLRHDLDIPQRIRKSFQEHTLLWIGAAAAVGTIIVLAPMRKKTIYIDATTGARTKPKSKLLEAGFLLGALRIAATVLKPTIEKFVAKKIGSYVGNRRSTRF